MRHLIIGVVLILSVTGCSSGSAGDEEVSIDLTSQQELELWASDLCDATGRLNTTVDALTDAIDVDVSAGLNQLPQIYEQLQARMGEIDAGIDDVEGVLADAPASSPEAGIFAAQVQALVASARTSGNDAVMAAGRAVNAEGFIEAGVAVASAVAAAQKAYEEASAAQSLLQGVRNGSDRNLSDAFEAAPACQSPQ